MKLEYYPVCNGYRIKCAGVIGYNEYMISGNLNLSLAQYYKLLKSYGAIYFNRDHTIVFNSPIFINEQDASSAIEKLESIIIMNKLL